MNQQTIVITGAASGFGALTAKTLSRRGHTVYAGILDPDGRNAEAVTELRQFAAAHETRLDPVEMDVTSQRSVDAAFARIQAEASRIDVLIHNAGHMTFGPAEAFTPEQLAAVYDVNAIGTQRVNRAALPRLRRAGQGLVLWVGSTSTRGGGPPYLGPYFAAKAAMDALAVCYAGELARWGVETTILVPGVFTGGTNHFAHADAPADKERAAEYEDGACKGLGEQILKGVAASVPASAGISLIADAMVRIVEAPPGSRPFRVHVDPAQDGAAVVNGVADRVRAEFLRNAGLADLLPPNAGL